MNSFNDPERIRTTRTTIGSGGLIGQEDVYDAQVFYIRTCDISAVSGVHPSTPNKALEAAKGTIVSWMNGELTGSRFGRTMRVCTRPHEETCEDCVHVGTEEAAAAMNVEFADGDFVCHNPCCQGSPLPPGQELRLG